MVLLEPVAVELHLTLVVTVVTKEEEEEEEEERNEEILGEETGKSILLSG